MTTIVLHPSAAKRIAELGENLVREVASGATPLSDQQETGFTPDVVVDHIIEWEDIISLRMDGRFDIAGDQLSGIFSIANQNVEIAGNLLQRFRVVCDCAHKQPPIRAVIAHRNVVSTVHKWLQSRLDGATVPPLPDSLIEALSKQIAEREVWVPLPNLCIESTIPVLRRGYLRAMSRDVIDSWIQRIVREHAGDDTVRFSQVFERRRRDLQGYAAGVFTITGDPELSAERAIEHTQNAIAVLRLFHAGSGEPYAICATDVKYAATRRGYVSIAFAGSGHAHVEERALASAGPPWELSSKAISLVRQIGFDDIISIFDDEQPSELARQYMDAVVVYSRVSLWVDLADRLMYAFVALESLFLKSDSEGIQQNLAERLAWFVGTTLDERKRIVKVTRAMYAQRSAFVHHAERVADVEGMREFMRYAWSAIVSLPKVLGEYATREEFLSALDDKKLS